MKIRSIFGTTCIIIASCMAIAAEDAVTITPPKGVKNEIGVMKIGSLRCVDAPYTVTVFPELFAKQQSITIARGDRLKPGSEYMFGISKAATVYLCVMKKGDAKLPEGWKKTEYTIEWTTDGKTKFVDAVFERSFEAGEVAVPKHMGLDGGTYAIPHLCVVVPK
ncbi:MAG: hypothetical protein HZC28_06625 [Spirochaetes bacterium]|nr:hypothetical protein [Spirochaetota bacterium]